jgi:hypothetical protein
VFSLSYFYQHSHGAGGQIAWRLCEQLRRWRAFSKNTQDSYAKFSVVSGSIRKLTDFCQLISGSTVNNFSANVSSCPRLRLFVVSSHGVAIWAQHMLLDGMKLPAFTDTIVE